MAQGQENNIRFVRINGRIVPIKQKGTDGNPAGKNKHTHVKDRYGRLRSVKQDRNTPKSVLKSARLRKNETVVKDSSGQRYAVSEEKRSIGDRAARFGFGFTLAGGFGAAVGGAAGAAAGAVASGIGTLASKRFKIKKPSNLIGRSAAIGAVGIGLGAGTSIGVGLAQDKTMQNSRRIGVKNKKYND